MTVSPAAIAATQRERLEPADLAIADRAIGNLIAKAEQELATAKSITERDAARAMIRHYERILEALSQ